MSRDLTRLGFWGSSKSTSSISKISPGSSFSTLGCENVDDVIGGGGSGADDGGGGGLSMSNIDLGGFTDVTGNGGIGGGGG